MNCTEDPSRHGEIHFRSPFAFWTLGVISVILSILSDVGNLINLFVLSRRHMHSTMTTLLVTLAWADLVSPTVVSMNNILFYYFLPHLQDSSTFLTTHVITRAIFNVLANIFTTFSNWLIVLITTFRLIVVKQPLVAKNYCNRRTARYTIIIILILSIFVNLPLFLYTNIRMFCTNNGSVKYYGLETSSLLRTPFFVHLFYPTMVVISLLIPWLICFLIWLFLIRALRSAQSQLTTKNTNTTFRNDRKQDTYFRITLMIVCVLTVYMICRSAHLVEVINIFIAPLFSYQQQISFNQIRIKLYCISNIMLTINHGANFYIYSINPKFRLTLKLYIAYYFRRCRIKRRRAFTLFHLRRKKTNDSLDGLSTQNEFNRSIMLTTPNINGKNYMINNKPNQTSLPSRIYQQNHTINSIRTPQKYLKQFIDVNSHNENSEKSYVWKEIEQKLKHHRRNYLR
ncbi:unnamed protein product [Adineta steineri]|uniref:G-protein coupled receptors family 1 profile domain-containing protein n=1 Tax=Adineta steineri TaxID=433720 RepID=A0A813YMR6_9BILA|nr:unnamed protein product [Adineta steineri]CAF1190036.1 unnamed protein product [Adineta steineri]CAF1373222.1 unnamed protein product [Adineta steineri]CAF1487872.1 unnamed protein product [Adineta steineri]CAF3807467.1 unnamed protein product [Adineta steineri]